MKKQILFMMFLSLALIFAGMNKVFAQPYTPPHTTDPASLGGAPECFKPDELTCTTGGGELNPIPGHPYTYTVEDALIENGTPVASVHWFVYDNDGGALITDGVLIDTNPVNNPNVDPGDGDGDFLAAVNSGSYNQSSTTIPDDFTIELSWKYFDPAREVLLVAYITGDECADNIEVFRIRPAFAFILDVASLMPDGKFKDDNDRTLSADRCVSEVWSAAYDNDNNLLQIDYGANYLYFLVSAANFGHSWQPTMSAEHNVTTPSTISEIVWAFPDEAADQNFTAWNAHDAVVNAPGNGTVGEGGQCIVVRVLVEHGIVENADPSTVTLSVEGHMYNPSAATGDQYADFHHLENPKNAGDPCVDDIADTADYILTPRPKITEVNPPAGSFVPKP